MSCLFSKEWLALYVEGDLSPTPAAATVTHLAACEECRQFLDQFRSRQSLLKSLRRETASPGECAVMRRDVMAVINGRQERAGWMLRIERTMMLGVRSRSYALAAFVLIGVVSVSVVAQMRQTFHGDPSGAVFEEGNTLVRPEGYRDWVPVGSPSGDVDGRRAAETGAKTPRVYLNPAAYREYVKTGAFPEGTLLVWESVDREREKAERPHGSAAVLLALVKDSARFDGGWGYFDFTGAKGHAVSRAEALPESRGCRTCHRKDGDIDPVLSAINPVLQSPRRSAHAAPLQPEPATAKASA